MNFVAHRGYSQRYPENSLPAFEAVLNHPSSATNLIGIELDIQLTADNQIIILHDTSLTNHQGASVAVGPLTLQQAQELMHCSSPHAPPLARLEQCLALVNHRLELNIELKAGCYPRQTMVDTLLG
jgi:glycerophosphoryl diester phosphodiesterase